jgi:protein-tyrosine-phosphatase
MKDKMAALKIGAPDPFFGRPLARTTRDALASRGISAPEGWETRELTSDMVKEADLIITVLPDQKKDLVRLFPKAAGRIFTIREISEWDDYLLQEDYDFKEIPRDSTLWDYVEENPDYVSNILFEMEKMLIKAYPSIMAKLRLRVGE